VDTFQFKDRLAALGARLLREGGKVFLHDVIQKAGNALVETVRIGEFFKARIEHPATFEERRKSVFDNCKGCADFAGATPCIIKSDPTCGHIKPSLHCAMKPARSVEVF